MKCCVVTDFVILLRLVVLCLVLSRTLSRLVVLHLVVLCLVVSRTCTLVTWHHSCFIIVPNTNASLYIALSINQVSYLLSRHVTRAQLFNHKVSIFS